MDRNKLDLDALTTKLQARIVDARRNYRFWEILMEILQGREGQKITKRIATAFEKHPEMQGYLIHYSTDFGMYHIRIWDNGIKFDHSPSFLLGYHSSGRWKAQGTVNLEEIRDHFRWAELEKGRADSLEAALPSLPGLIQEWNDGCGQLQDIHDRAVALSDGLRYEIRIASR